MKKYLIVFSFLLSLPAFAQVQINDLSKDDVEDVTKEFGANFAHTAVAAPETDGIWGVEVGVIAGQTKSPNFSDVVDASGGDGKDFKSIYHAGLMARAHFPWELFAEVTFLPEQEFDDVKIKSQSFSVGWNAGAFFNLPLDLAVGVDRGTGELNFSQDQDLSTNPVTPQAKVKFETTTTVMWLGVSKTFWFVTPYAKLGSANIDGELNANASVLGFGNGQKEEVDLSGKFMAVGANVELGLLKLGVEASQVHDVRRATAKLSLDF